MRAIFEALGATVDWSSNAQTVTAIKGSTVIKLSIGGYEMYKDSSAVVLDVPAIIVNNRTYVPARVVSEAFDCDVNWDGDTKTVLITDKLMIYNYIDENMLQWAHEGVQSIIQGMAKDWDWMTSTSDTAL